jgi:hypothetical protein
MKISELKEIIKNWPETYETGEETEVWIMTENGLSSPVEKVTLLNKRDNVSDILFE